jgi:hypothetical protein
MPLVQVRRVVFRREATNNDWEKPEPGKARGQEKLGSDWDCPDGTDSWLRVILV